MENICFVMCYQSTRSRSIEDFDVIYTVTQKQQGTPETTQFLLDVYSLIIVYTYTLDYIDEHLVQQNSFHTNPFHLSARPFLHGNSKVESATSFYYK